MSSLRLQVDEHLLDLAWRQWTELGVAGARGGYSNVAVAPEELVLLTSTLAGADPRLRDESIDWCVRYAGHVSKPRLKNLLKRSSAATRDAFGRYSATVNASSRVRWPGADGAKPWRLKLSGKSVLPSLQRPELLHLRLRALVGVSARADIIAAFLASPYPSFSAADLVELGYTKRNIADTLDSLAAAGLLRPTKVRNQIKFQWARRAEVEELLRPLPDRIPRWPSILEFVTGIRELALRVDGKSDTVCGVEAVKYLRGAELTLQHLGLDAPQPAAEPAATWRAFSTWACEHLKALAHGKSVMLVGTR